MQRGVVSWVFVRYFKLLASRFALTFKLYLIEEAQMYTIVSFSAFTRRRLLAQWKSTFVLLSQMLTNKLYS